MKIGDYSISTVDFPGTPSLVIFLAGCPFRCPYCHNPELINGGKNTPLNNIYKKILQSKDLVDAIVISGGEPLLQIDETEKILEFAKSQNLKTKLDTNGYQPKHINRIKKLVDYVALDVKVPFEKYERIFGFDGSRVRETMNILSKSKVFLECRTTYVPGLLKPEDIISIASQIQCDLYVIQQFRNNMVLDPKFKNVNPPSPSILKDIAKKAKKYCENVKIRTQEFGEEKI
ncbi:MAG TPA: anaerobic ribonucleoside-triphosphate reductase activating protein [Methanothermobacter sp.]|jgi:pyruvate formate lyase activating enzyme|uniref:Anaerobic ribonucleoside-triphosphate reductase activating protein n=1 Tax=Methanothermobacter tenebrarum TaxID=680118 RepID=A0ABM7YEP1_9EURY|nr:anaerobic ribonucleoside-triphosphate reductase activating protein [Methanothermobacter tenebrarum]MDX9693350.1 anaerobic ribonucleoside-triphosphate reductase activating protein [Methanothermobacter sp.]BDH79884.1 anaerobic ribonucleoside-triphosphate reductase activating protein [Methanothermobacter tenebrarum]HHW16785.1 anaerobic ribonucleoside-triphosphate reductase activating protein [Methanothermobacter sp.]HPU37745.1 anaerobic ribonucleoside-triphosphate reductase activating protein [